MKLSEGFTLLELLVAISLLGMLVLGLTPALRLAGQAWDTVGRSADAAQVQQTAQSFLRTAIAQTYPASSIDEAGRRTLAYRGESDQLAMVTPMPTQLGLGGLQVVRLFLDGDSSDRTLVAGWTPLPSDGSAFVFDDDARRVVLARDVNGFELHYYGSPDPNEPPRWSERWEGERTLPKLVSLRVTFGNGSAWPDLLVQPMVDLGAMVTR